MIVSIGMIGIIIGLYVTQFALADIGTDSQQILDQCTPYSINGKGNETRNEIPIGINQTAFIINNTAIPTIKVSSPCSQSMMEIKGYCDHNLLDIQTISTVCTDPRYQDWLLHDFNATAWRIYNGAP